MVKNPTFSFLDSPPAFMNRNLT